MSLSDVLDGPVQVSEVQLVVAHLRHLSSRAAESEQRSMHFVLSVAAESLSDNLEVAASGDDDE